MPRPRRTLLPHISRRQQETSLLQGSSREVYRPAGHMPTLLRMRERERPAFSRTRHFSHMSNQPGVRASTAGKTSAGWTKTRTGGNDDVTMGTRQSTVAAPPQHKGGKALAWSAEVTWSDDSGAAGRPHPSGKRPLPRGGDGEWCTGTLGGASGVGMGGGANVVLSWSWTSSWR